MKSNEEIAQEIINGYWGNGEIRKQNLIKAGYNYYTIQNLVNAIMSGKPVITTQEPEQPPEKFLEVELNLEQYEGIKINLIIGGECNKNK